MIRITDKKTCCGCTACASVCNHHAIQMKADPMGFKYPVVDKSKCVDCGLCDRVCAFNDNYDQSLQFDQPFAYAVRHKDMKEIMTSRSGAAFIAFSDEILSRGGVVYGAAFNKDFSVSHKRATTKKQRDEFKGSKYIQSNLSDIFRNVKEDLISGHLVLFSGTGCQCAGLNSYIDKKLRENLFLIDIVCHGVSSPIVWKDYLAYQEKKLHKKIESTDFRNKTEKGWRSHFESFTLSDNSIYYSDYYAKLYYCHICLRPSCGECHYCNLHRPSDLTLADYWGFERTSPEFNADDKGCSLVLVNTEKGKVLFEKIKNDINYLPAELQNITQGHLEHPTQLHHYSNLFSLLYPKVGFHLMTKFLFTSKYYKNKLHFFMRKMKLK